MTWAFLAGGAAIFYALHGAWSARVARAAGPLLSGWALFTFALPFLFAYLAATGLSAVGIGYWPVWIINSLINLGASYLFMSALRIGDLGLTYPLLALTPVFVIPIEWGLLGELPGPWGGVGIALVVLGVYLLNFRERRGGLLAPFRALASDPGAVRMLVVAVLWSVSGTLDRVAVLESSPAFYGFTLSAALSILYLPLVLRAGRRSRTEPGLPAGVLGRISGAGVWVLVLHGLLFAAMLTLQMTSLSMALASYVLSIKRSGAIFAVLLGYLAFREGTLGPRLVGAAVVVSGACVLVIWG
ncbi:MAG: DMT family transporter [Gemmatimonadota bacterium]